MSRLDFWICVSQGQQFQPPLCSPTAQQTQDSKRCSTPSRGAPNLSRFSPNSFPHTHAGARLCRSEGFEAPVARHGPAGQGGRVRPAALPGPWPRRAPWPRSGCADHHTGTKAPGRFPCSTPSAAEHPKEGCGPTGTTGHPGGSEGMLREQDTEGCRGSKRYLRAAWRDAEDARRQHEGCRGCHGCSGQDRDAGADLTGFSPSPEAQLSPPERYPRPPAANPKSEILF
ncbi:uncharacterized protein LOC115346878 [Aquila chrysaetos chrysaetos]|uniref:uncharacterized protein LOC115346878 n=1 Tax=Aquila chrysaetos chrysaetos TaxID=223781 RepID=UPI001176A0BC|nr:uncharacterized protein LOC115346878 [Aquila chrysaetos chrysaetos]